MLSIKAASIIGKYFKYRFFEKKEITEEDLAPILREIRIALLNSDVNIKVIKEFLAEVKDDLLVKKNYSSADKVDVVVFSAIKKKLTKVLGNENKDISYSPNKLNRILMIGLNGSGKTTTTAKLSYFVKNKHKAGVRNISLDIYRPGAYDQLKTLSDGIGVDCVWAEKESNFKDVIKEQITSSEKEGVKFLFFDCYGLFPDNEELLKQTEYLKKLINPTEILMVIDASSGQEILDTAQLFHDRLGITGIVASKSDSDAPMGGVFSVSYLLKIPIKFLGKGETVKDLSKFYPDRIASVILGEGDILSLAEKLESELDADASKRLFSRIMNGHFDLNDLLTQIKEFRKAGPIKNVLKLVPGAENIKANTDSWEQQLRIWEIIINSMTPKERKNPKLFKKQPNRRVRVIKGSGRKPEEFNKLLKRWEESKKKIEEMVGTFKRGKGGFSLSSLMNN